MRRIHKFKTNKSVKLSKITSIEISDEVYNYMTENQSDGVMYLMEGIIYPQSPKTLMRTLEWFIGMGDEQDNEWIRFIIRDLSSAVMNVNKGLVKLV